MRPALTLLDGVCWQGVPVAGERSQTLLAVLALHAHEGASDERLVGELWPDDRPANPTKALQVVVSRTRAATAPEVVARTARGYRLGLPDELVDVLLLEDLVDRARAALADGDVGVARSTAQLAVELVGGSAERTTGALAELQAVATERLAGARRVLGAALSQGGEHEAALSLLERAVAERPHDEHLLTWLLRSEAAARSAAAALDRYERYRADLADRTGTDPGPGVARVHAELLAADRPVREGVRFDGSSLLGRDDDLHALQALLHRHRVVSVVGPGGLGKTRLAHVVGRNAEQPVVHFVELVGVTAPEAVVGEVGSALGVRDSVSGRRVLTPAQRADIRARIAQQLDQVPALLIVDNCEHLVEAVADLVAFLTATTRDVRILTTSRAPLAIPAERVYALGELRTGDGVELFRQRAIAARPDVRIDEAVVADVVTRLDGLPLAIELAAAKVRVMSVDDISRRLEDRFALLRGGDRSAPDRHQTLLAVIDWSWNLLSEPDRRALRWLSVFHDGFTLAAAESVLGHDALDAVQSLTEQSLLGVWETEYGVRYRMLETVREFGRMALVNAGEEAQARAAQRAWATSYAREHGSLVFGPAQFEAMDALRAEEGNLAELLRQAFGEPDRQAAVQLLAGIGAFWLVRGDHARIISLCGAIEEAVAGWQPPAELEDATRSALVLTLSNAMILGPERLTAVRDLLGRLGIGETTDRRLAAMITVTFAAVPGYGSDVAGLDELSRSDDRDLALAASQMLSHALENMGDPAAAAEAARQALTLLREDDGPWLTAILHAQLAHLTSQLGDRRSAIEHAAAALPVLDRLGADDDVMQLRSVLLSSAIVDGDYEAAETELEKIARVDDHELAFGGLVLAQMGTAELELARGEVAAGLAGYRAAIERVRDARFPGMPHSGSEPWVLAAEASALTAYAHHAGPEELAFGEELFRVCGDARIQQVLDTENPFLDFPVCGLMLFALGAWGLRRGAVRAGDAVRLLVLADRFAYNRTVPTTAFKRIEPYAEESAPGMIAAVREEYGARRGPELLDEARALVEKLAGSAVPGR